MSDSNRTATDVVSVKSDGTPATKGYIFDSIDAFSTGHWMQWKNAGVGFANWLPSRFEYLGTSSFYYIGGSLRVNGGDVNQIAFKIGNGTLPTQDILFDSLNTGQNRILLGTSQIPAVGMIGDDGSSLTRFALLDDAYLQIHGILDGSGFRVNPRITTIMDVGAASPGAFQIFNKTNPAAGYKLLQLITDGSGAAPVKWDLDVDGHMKMTGAIDHEHNSFAANHQTSNESIVGMDTTASPWTVTLSSADALFSGRTIIIKDEGGNAGTNAITIDTQGTETIDGAASTSIATNYGTVRVYSNGSNWFTF